MSLFPQYAWLEALGWTIVNSWWQFGMLWMSWLLLQKVWPRASASHRYNLAIAHLLVGTAWFIIGFAVRLIAPDEELEPILNTPHAAQGWDYLQKLPPLLFPYLSLVYLVWLGTRLFHLFFQYQQVKKSGLSGLKKLAPTWRIFTESMAAQMNIGRPVQLWMSEKIDCPQIMGWIKPIILLPASALSQLSSAQLEAILIHELAHIKRNDYIWNWIISIIENLLFFNPFVKLFISTIRAEREHACDDFVLQFPFQPQLYAEALLKLEQKRTAREMSLVLAAGGSSRKLLLTRVRRMLNIEHALPIRKGYSSLLFLLALSSSLALLIPNNPVTKQWADQLAEPVAALENKLFQGLNYQSMRWNSTPIYVEAAAKDPVSPPVSQAVQTPSKTAELIDNQDQSIDNQENIESEVIVDNSTNDWVEQLNTGSTAPAALYLAAAPLAAEAKAFTFEKSQKNIDLPAEAATIYMHPYVPRKSFETTVVIDTTPALTKHLQAKAKAQEAALQTQLALDKLNWSRVQEQISKLGTGSSRQELQLVLETELAKLNWEEIQQQSKQLIKKLSQLELEKIQSRQEQTQEILQEKLEVLEELTLELKKTEQSLEQAIQQKEKELKKKQEQLRKKHKIVHI